jgi:hypothetical protein
MKHYPYFILCSVSGPVRVEIDNGHNIITHLQKFSRVGFLFHLPFGFHIWVFWRKQQQDVSGGWIPGSEQGIYFRTPGWRYTSGEGMTWTNGYIGGRWD